MKTNIDQISIPPLCRGPSEMAHTLVGKAVHLQLQRHGFKPQCRQFTEIQAGFARPWNHFSFGYFCFFCALILSPLLGIPENAGVMWHFRPLVGPVEVLLNCAQACATFRSRRAQPCISGESSRAQPYTHGCNHMSVCWCAGEEMPPVSPLQPSPPALAPALGDWQPYPSQVCR